MILLNLGCGTPDTESWAPIEGCVNLDRSLGWRFEDGLGAYATGSIDGITVSHALMYVELADWPAVFAEFARVLRDGGVVRITEDETQDTRSPRHGGWRGSQPAITLTFPELVKAYLRAAGLVAHDCDPGETRGDPRLVQHLHGDPPDVFHVEGVRMTRVLFEPHADDAALFAAFTVIRYRPRVVTCFGSSGDYGPTDVRAAETIDAMSVLGCDLCEQWDGGDLQAKMRELDARIKPSLVFAPAAKTSHRDHVAVAEAAAAVFGDRLRTYHTYDETGRIKSPWQAPYEPAWVQRKLRALCRYPSQATHPRACRFYLDDQREYLGEE